MKEVHLLTNLDQVKLIADPLRQRILKTLCGQEMTTAQLSEELSETPTNLYYHVDKLRDAGLIELTRTQQKRGTVEKYYRPVAERYELAPDLLKDLGADTAAGGGLMEVVRGSMSAAVAELSDSLEKRLISTDEDSPHHFIFGAFKLRGGAIEVGGFGTELEEWAKKVANASEAHPEVEGEPLDESDIAEYSVVVLMFPTQLPEEEPPA